MVFLCIFTSFCGYLCLWVTCSLGFMGKLGKMLINAIECSLDGSGGEGDCSLSKKCLEKLHRTIKTVEEASNSKTIACSDLISYFKQSYKSISYWQFIKNPSKPVVSYLHITFNSTHQQINHVFDNS